MNNSIDPHHCKMYYNKGCVGKFETYHCGVSEVLQRNDVVRYKKFMSCSVGSNCRLLLWECSDPLLKDEMTFKVMQPGLHNDMGMMVEKFQIVDTQFEYAIDIRFKDASHRPRGSLHLTCVPTAQELAMPPTKIPSDPDIYCSIPILSQWHKEMEITMDLSVQDMVKPNGSIISKGQVVFVRDPKTGIINCKKTNAFPHNMEIVRDDKTYFTITCSQNPK
eukprot:gene5761-7169_t